MPDLEKTECCRFRKKRKVPDLEKTEWTRFRKKTEGPGFRKNGVVQIGKKRISSFRIKGFRKNEEVLPEGLTRTLGRAFQLDLL